jgi:hypothetical protein
MKKYILNCVTGIILLIGIFLPILSYAASVKDSRKSTRSNIVKTREVKHTEVKKIETNKPKAYKPRTHSRIDNKNYKKSELEFNKSFKFSPRNKIYEREEFKTFLNIEASQEIEDEKGVLESFFRDIKKKESYGGPVDEYWDYWRYYWWRRDYSGYRRPYYYPYDYPYYYTYGYQGRDYEYEEAYEQQREYKTFISLNYQRIDASLWSYGGELDLIGYKNMGFSMGWYNYEEDLDDGIESLMQFDASFLYEFMPIVNGEIGIRSINYQDESTVGLKLGLRGKIPVLNRIDLWVKPSITIFRDGTLIGFDGGFSVKINSFFNLFGSYRGLISSSQSLSGPSIGISTNFKFNSSIFR